MNNNDLVIRVASVDDADVIFKIDSEYEFDQYSKELICGSLKDENCISYIAFIDNVAIGYISISNVVDEAEILKLVVVKNFRGCGLGTKFMLAVLEMLRQKSIKIVFLEVRKSNILAKKLYEKSGFVKINQRIKYYEDGEDADIYRLNFYE